MSKVLWSKFICNFIKKMLVFGSKVCLLILNPVLGVAMQALYWIFSMNNEHICEMRMKRLLFNIQVLTIATMFISLIIKS